MDFTINTCQLLKLAISYQLHVDDKETRDFIITHVNSMLANIYNEGFSRGLTQGQKS